jgi:sulfur-carrier protein
MMKILFFARMRQLAGRGEIEMELPAGVKTVGALIDVLRRDNEGLAQAFADMRIVRAAVDKQHVPLDASIEGAKEVAFFPPVTGG